MDPTEHVEEGSADPYWGMAEPASFVETILLVDDDPLVRRVTVRLLCRSRYRVLEATGGEEALQLLRASGGAVDLLVTDIVMPGLDGWELGEHVRAEFPSVRILYTSGFAEGEVRARLSRANSSFLPKPFDLITFTRAVQEVLASDPEVTDRVV